MSLTQLPEHYQTDFGDNWTHLVQQKESRLEGKTIRVTVNGKERTFSQLGKSKMRLITTRNGKTIPSNTAMAKRWLRPKGYDEVTYIDEFDDVALGELPKPESEHVVSHAMSAKRTMDEVTIAGLEGTAYIGEDGTTTVDLGAGQKVVVNWSGSNEGLTLAKVLEAKRILDSNEVEQEGRYFVIASQQLADLLNDVEEVKSADYSNVKALIDGHVTRFGGFDFVMTELLTLTTSTDVRTCIAYQRQGIAVGVSKEKKVKISIRDDLNETIQIRTVMGLGATRLEEERVVLVYCDESP